jgi:hypothetical protein
MVLVEINQYYCWHAGSLKTIISDAGCDILCVRLTFFLNPPILNGAVNAAFINVQNNWSNSYQAMLSAVLYSREMTELSMRIR